MVTNLNVSPRAPAAVEPDDSIRQRNGSQDLESRHARPDTTLRRSRSISGSDSDSSWDTELLNTVRKRDGKHRIISEEKRIDELQECLEEGANIYAVDGNGNTILHLSVRRGYEKIVKFLLSRSVALCEIRNANGEIALDIARRLNRTDVSQILESFVAKDEGISTSFEENVKNGSKCSNTRTQTDRSTLTDRPKVVPCNTKGDGHCFFHAVFGTKNVDGIYEATRAKEMREEWYTFLSQYNSLKDDSMPEKLKEQLRTVFLLFLSNPNDLTRGSSYIKPIVEETRRKIDDAETEVRKLKNRIADNFHGNAKFRKEVLEAMHTSRNNKQVLDCQDLIENRRNLLYEISNDLEKYYLILYPNLHESQFRTRYNSQTITDLFLENSDLYKQYLDAILRPEYFVFYEEIPILASLANTKITVHSGIGAQCFVFKPNQEMVGTYKTEECLWGDRREVTIIHEQFHYSHAVQEDIRTILPESLAEMQSSLTGRFTDAKQYQFTPPQGEREYTTSEHALEESKGVSAPICSAAKVDRNLSLSRKNFRESLIALSRDSSLSNKEKIELQAFPSPYVLAQLSSKVYTNKKSKETDRDYEKRLQLPEGWKLLTLGVNTHLTNGYVGAAFWNAELRQVVVAHRGTENFGSFCTDVQGIVWKKYASRMYSAITFADEIACALREIPGPAYHLSCTGHSLGGWLAQVTAFSTKYLTKGRSHFVRNSGSDGVHSHTVVFDSPGCEDMLLKMKKDFDLRYESSIQLNDLDVTSYLSAPNRINTSNSHVGKIYRIFTNLSDMSTLDKHTPTYNLATHNMSNIALVFDPKTGEVFKDSYGKKRIQEVVDWPVSKSLFGGKEYRNFFKKAEHFNDFHPEEKDEELACNEMGSIRYKTKHIDERVCPIHTFSQDEMMLLESWNAMINANIKLKILEQFAFEHSLQDCNPLLPNFKILLDKGKKHIACDNKELLTTLVNRVKQLLRWFSVDFTKAMKAQFIEIPSAVEAMFKVETTNYLNSVMKCVVDFKDILGLNEFLKSKTERMFHVRTEDIEFEVSRICNICEHFRDINRNCETDSGLEKYVDLNHIILSWRQVLNLNKFVDISSILEPKRCGDLLILTCLTQDEVTKECESIVKLFSCLSGSNIYRKIIFVTTKESSVNKYVSPVKAILKGKVREVETGVICLNDFTPESQEILLSKPIIYLQNQPVSLKFFCSAKNKEEETKFIDSVGKLIDNNMLKNLVVENTQPITIENELETTDSEVSYVTISQDVGFQSAVDFLLNGDKIRQSVSDISGENAKSVIFLVSGVQEDEICRVLSVKDDPAEAIRNALRKTIHLSGEQHSSLKFKQLCREYPDHRIYWLDLSKGVATWKFVYDSDFYINRQFGDQVILRREIRNFFMGEPSHDFFIFGNTSKTTLIKMLEFSEEESKAFSKCKNFQAFNHEKAALLKFEEMRRNDRPVHLVKVDGESNKFIWQKTSGSLENIRRYVDTDNPAVDEESLSEKKDKFVIISGDPGMGKSTSLRSISRRMKKCWIIHKDFKDYQSIMGLSSNLSMDEVVRYLSKDQKFCSNDLTMAFFKECLVQRGIVRVVLLFDGFDEIKKGPQPNGTNEGQNKTAQEKVIDVLQFLNTETNAFVWVTSRRLQSHVLENTFSVFATKFEELNDVEQQIFFRKFWLSRICVELNAYGEKENGILDQYINGLIKAAKSVLGREISRFMGIPLQMRMIAEVMQPSFKSLCEAPEQYCKRILQIDNVFDLYQRFVEAKYNIYFHEKTSLSDGLSEANKNWLVDILNRKHRSLAFQTLFGDEAAKFLGNKTVKMGSDVREEDEVELNRVGLIQSNGSGGFDFLHLTFAEYFVADLLAYWLKKPLGRHPKYSPVEDFLVQKILLRPEFKVVRLFLNNHLTKFPMPDEAQKFYIERITKLWSENREVFYGRQRQICLHVASHENCQALAEFLLGVVRTDFLAEAYISLDLTKLIAARDKTGKTALYVAAESKSVEVIDKYGALMLRSREHVKQTLLLSTVYRGVDDRNDSNIKFLLDYLSESGCIQRDSFVARLEEHYKLISPFIAAAGKNNLPELKESLKKCQDDNYRVYLLSCTDESGKTALHVASEKGYDDAVDYLLDENAEVNVFDGNGMTPLHHACTSPSLHVARRLVDGGCDAHARDNYNMTTLAWSAKSGRLDIAKYLLKLGVDLGVPDRNGIGPIQHAAKSGHLDVVEFLLEHGASMNATDKFGMSALAWAAKSGHENVVRYLSEKGVNMDIQDRYGMSVLQIAIKASEWKIVHYLVRQGADVNSCDWNGVNALQRLIKAGRWAEVKLLVTYGARLNTNWKGNSALGPLIKARKWDVLLCLISRGAGLIDRGEEALVLRGVLGGDVSKVTDVHNAFCRLIKLGNVRLLELLLEELSSQAGFESPSLYCALSKSYEELNVKGVRLSSDMQYAVESKLIESRFFIDGEPASERNEMSLEQIKQCIDNVSESAKELNKGYFGDSEKEVDEAFVHTTKYITQNIHVLKKHLKNTYSVLPWEEMEFCLINFIYSTVNSQYTDEISRLFVGKDVILGHLRSFCAKLDEVKSTLGSKDVKSKGKLAGRSVIIQNVIANSPEFENLYSDYSVIKDIYSLKRIDTYLRSAVSVDLKKEGELGKLLIQRALQVMGESLKNTPESPNVSENIHQMLLDSAPRYTKEIITSLRDSLSHADTLTKKVQLEEGKDSKFFEEVQNDLKKIGNETLEILYKKKIEALKIFLRKIVNCTMPEELVSLAKLFSQRKLDKINFLELRTKEMENLDELLRKLNQLLKNSSTEQRNILKKIEEIIATEACKSQKIKERYVKGTKMMRSVVRSDNHTTIRNLAEILLNTLTVDGQKLKEVVELCKDLSKYIDVKTDANAFHTFYKIFSIIEFEVGRIKGIDEVKENLSKNDTEEKQFIKERIDETFAFIENIITSDEERKKFREEIKARFDVHQARQVLISHFRNKKTQENVPIPKEYKYSQLVDNLNLKPKDKENLQRMCDNGEFAKCLSLIQKTDDKYAVLVKSLEEISTFSTEKYVEAFKSFFSQKKGDVYLEGILKAIEQEHTQNVILYFNQRLSVLKRLFENQENRNEFLIAMEMVILDLSEILEHSSLLADNKTFLLGYSPVLVGKSLRNYLAHGDPLVDLLPFSSSTAIANHGRMLLEMGQELITRRDRLLGSACPVDVSETRERHIRHLQLLATQRELFSAAGRGDLEAVKHSIGRGADPTATNIDGLTALDFAVRSDQVDVFKFLVDRNLSIDTKRVLRQAVHSGSISVIRYLTEELMVNIKGPYFKDEEFLHCASWHGHAVVVQHLLHRGADINAVDKESNSPLHTAAVNSHKDVAAVLLEAGADVNVGEDERRTALHLSSLTGSVAVVRLLLKYGARVNAKFKLKNWTPLHLASFHGNSDVIEVLLAEGAELEAGDDDGNRPLYWALRESQHEAALALIAVGAKLDCWDETGCGPLHRAAEDGHDAVVRALLDRGVSVKDVAHDDMTALHFAAKNGHVAVVRTLASRGADVDATTKDDQWTPLFLAAQCGHGDVVRELLGRGASVDARSELGLSALHVAALGGHSAVVSTLLENGAPVGSVTRRGWTPLHFAAQKSGREIARILLERDGCLVDAESTEGIRPVHIAAGAGCAEMTEFLLSQGAKLESKMKAGFTPLLLACGGGFPDVLDVLLRQGANVMERDVTGKTALHHAAANGHRRIAATLIKQGADVEAVDVEHHTALYVAAENGHNNVVDLVCSKAVVNVCARGGKSPLFVATAKGFTDVVSTLLAKGADPIGSSREFSPLQVAALNGLSDVATLLLSRGADPNERCANSSTPLLAAAEGNRTDVIRLLLHHGADVNVSDDNGMTALHKATTLGYDDLVLLLLEAGARVDARTDNDGTSLFMAARYGRVEVVRELLRRGADASVKEKEINRTAVEVAAICGHSEIVRLLIDDAPERAKQKVKVRALLLAAANGQAGTVRELQAIGVPPDAQDRERCTGLHLAARQGHAAVAETLLQGKAAVNATDSAMFTPLHYAALEGHAEVVRVLVGGGADPNACTYRRWEMSPEVARIYDELVRRMSREGARCPYEATPLHLAAYRGHDEAVAALLDGGGRVEARGGDALTAVHLAAMNGQVSTVRLLLSRGADPVSAGADGTTALAVAAFHGHREVVDALLEAGASVDERNSEQRTALHYGAYFGDENTVISLLDSHPDVHARDTNMWTPLHFAAFHGRREAVLLLIVHGAEVDARELDDGTPLHMACLNGHRGAVEALIDQGADVHAADSGGKTPLVLAVEGSHCEIAAALLRKGADANVRDGEGRTALHVSCERGDSELAQVLLQYKANPNVTDSLLRRPVDIVAAKMVDPAEDVAKFELLFAVLMSLS